MKLANLSLKKTAKSKNTFLNFKLFPKYFNNKALIFLVLQVQNY